MPLTFIPGGPLSPGNPMSPGSPFSPLEKIQLDVFQVSGVKKQNVPKNVSVPGGRVMTLTLGPCGPGHPGSPCLPGRPGAPVRPYKNINTSNSLSACFSKSDVNTKSCSSTLKLHEEFCCKLI